MRAVFACQEILIIEKKWLAADLNTSL